MKRFPTFLFFIGLLLAQACNTKINDDSIFAFVHDVSVSMNTICGDAAGQMSIVTYFLGIVNKTNTNRRIRIDRVSFVKNDTLVMPLRFFVDDFIIPSHDTVFMRAHHNFSPYANSLHDIDKLIKEMRSNMQIELIVMHFDTLHCKYNDDFEPVFYFNSSEITRQDSSFYYKEQIPSPPD